MSPVLEPRSVAVDEPVRFVSFAALLPSQAL